MSQPTGQLATTRAWTGRLLTVDLDRVRTPNGTELELEMVRHPGAAAVVPLLSSTATADPTILLIRQYRYATGGMLWEIPAGVLEAGEDPVSCARRELREETGAEAERIEHLTTIYTTPGFTDEVIHLFAAFELETIPTRHQVDEVIELMPMSLSEALQRIWAGEIPDAKSALALLHAARRVGRLSSDPP